jgi:amidase
VSVGPLAGEHRGGFGVDGVLTRTVRDTAAALDGISGPKLGDPYSLPRFDPPLRSLLDGEPPPLRVGVAVRRAHPECVAAVERAAELLGDAGHDVVEAAPRRWFDPMLADTTVVVRTAAMARSLDAWGHRIGRPLTEVDVEPANWYSAQLGHSLPATAYLAARDWLNDWCRTVAQWWTEFDLLLTPVLGAPPPPLGFLSHPDEGQQRLRELLGFADQANASGQPALSLPLHWTDDGLPVGVQLVAAGGREDLLVQVARWFEQAQPWAHRHPPLS